MFSAAWRSALYLSLGPQRAFSSLQHLYILSLFSQKVVLWSILFCFYYCFHIKWKKDIWSGVHIGEGHFTIICRFSACFSSQFILCIHLISMLIVSLQKFLPVYLCNNISWWNGSVWTILTFKKLRELGIDDVCILCHLSHWALATDSLCFEIPYFCHVCRIRIFQGECQKINKIGGIYTTDHWALPFCEWEKS